MGEVTFGAGGERGKVLLAYKKVQKPDQKYSPTNLIMLAHSYTVTENNFHDSMSQSYVIKILVACPAALLKKAGDKTHHQGPI